MTSLILARRIYEEVEVGSENSEGSKIRRKSMRHYGKYGRENIKSRTQEDAPLPISVFLVASVLKDKSPKLLKEAQGLDDVVKILNDIAGDIDAKKSCTNAMKLHKKYLKQMQQMERMKRWEGYRSFQPLAIEP